MTLIELAVAFVLRHPAVTAAMIGPEGRGPTPLVFSHRAAAVQLATGGTEHFSA
jgi:hypothetical protein